MVGDATRRPGEEWDCRRFTRKRRVVNALDATTLGGGKRWLAVGVRGPGEHDFTALTPRQVLGTGLSAPLAAPLAGPSCPHDHWGESWSGSGVGLSARSNNWIGVAGVGTTSLMINPLPLGIMGVYGSGDDVGVLGESGVGNGVTGNTASSSQSGVRGYNSGSGYGMTGRSENGIGVLGVNVNTGNYAELGTSLYGIHTVAWSGSGVYAQSPNGDGVKGETSASNKSGVYGYNAGGGFGVTAQGNDSLFSDRVGDLLLGGSLGEIVTYGSWLVLYTDGDAYIHLDDNNNGDNAFAILNGTNGTAMDVLENGDLHASGTKSAIVETASNGERLFYAMESPEVWFEDLGTAALVNGQATVPIESIFAETTNLESDYHIFLTPLGDCKGLYIAAKSPTSFEVREIGGGTDSISFDYRIVAKRRGYEQTRLKSYDSSTHRGK